MRPDFKHDRLGKACDLGTESKGLGGGIVIIARGDDQLLTLGRRAA